MHLHDLMEPEETVGNLWHEMAQGLLDGVAYPDAAASLADVRSSLSVLFRALGGAAGVELIEAAPRVVRHRRSVKAKLGAEREQEFRASFDGERLRLPPFIAAFPDDGLNRAAYFWLTALAAHGAPFCVAPGDVADARAFDLAQIAANAQATRAALETCPGLRDAHVRMVPLCLALRPTTALPEAERDVETALRATLADTARYLPDAPAPRGYMPAAPVPIWLDLVAPTPGDAAADQDTIDAPPPAAAATTTRKIGLRKDREQADRRDSFIIHRFESILSWVESMNLNRSVDDDDDENAQKAADDHDDITLSKNDRRAATRLRLSLDLSPSDADHEALAGEFTYPEWNHRSRSYMDAHTRVLDAPPMPPDAAHSFVPNAVRMRSVRRQFEALRPRRILRPRQIDGSELDLDALIAARADLAATGQSSDRIYLASRQIERDLAVAFLIDTSRSTEAAVGDTCVIDVARDALAALAGGIDAAGDALGIWGFSSLRRDRVFLTRCKDFDTDMSPAIIDNICALRPGHYTRLGAAIRHTSAMLAEQTAARKLLIVLTDGKPNDLDHYEGQHGIEDSHMAVREARRTGQAVHGVIIDEDGQDWFARIFGRGGFSLLPDPDRLARALPDIYRHLTQET